MRPVIFFLSMAMLLLALVLPAVRVARRSSAPWHRGLAVLLMLTAGSLLVFLFAEDDYTHDGRTNLAAYDVEYPAVPTVVGLLVGAWWLLHQAQTRAAAVAAPLLALGGAFGCLTCLLFTTN